MSDKNRLIEEIERVQKELEKTNGVLKQSSKVGLESYLLFLTNPSLFAIKVIGRIITEQKAKKILNSCYIQLTVKQNMLIAEQQKLIELINSKESEHAMKLSFERERLKALANQIESIKTVFEQRTVFDNKI